MLVVMLAPLAAVVGAEFQFRHYTTDNGLPSNCVRDIVQDTRGFIWLATDGGLVRFDGLHFKLYPLVCTGTREDNFISSVHEASDGIIYVGTDSGVWAYDAVVDSLSRLEAAAPDGQTMDGPVRHIRSDLSGNLWISVPSVGLCRVDPDRRSMAVYRFPEISDFVGDVFIDSSDNVWVASNQGNGALYRRDAGATSFRPVPVVVDGSAADTRALAIGEDANRQIWLGTWAGALLRIDPRSGAAKRVDGGPIYHIHTITPMTPSQLLIGSDAGLTVLDITNGEYLLYRNDELDAFSLSDRFVYPVLCDREGGVWAGTFYGGVNYAAPDFKHFERYRSSRYSNSVTGDLISAFAEGPDGDVWIASDDGGLCRRSAATGEFSAVPIGALGNNIHALCFDGGSLWVGSYTNGVGVIDVATGRMRRFLADHDDRTTIDNSSCYAIFRDSGGSLWVATMEGVNRFDRASGTFERIKHFGATTVDIDEAPDGTLWFSTQGRGIFSYNPRSGQWSNFRRADSRGALPHDHVYSIDFDAGGTMWVGTAGGLCRRPAGADAFERIELPVPNRNIMAVVVDGETLWLPTANGLVRYSPADGWIKTFTKRDGLSDNQFQPNAALRTSDGKIWLGSIGGVTAFFPERIRSNRFVPPVVFTGLDIMNRPVAVGSGKLPVELNSIDVLSLEPGDNMFSVSFASLSYDNPENITYAYRLEGFDRDWINAGNENKATYTNLPPGDYTLRVRASNGDSVWNETGAALRIHVPAPWYLSLPMKILYLLLALAVIASFVYMMLRRSERKHRVEISRITASHEQEVLAAKTSFFTMVAHEIRTPVSLIIGPLEKIRSLRHEFTSEVNADLEIIDRNGRRLLFLVNQLLDFRKVERHELHVVYRPTVVARLLDSVAERFRPSLRNKGITLRTDYPDPEFEADIDAEAITKLTSNLLNNARKFTESEIDLAFSVNAAAGVFTITVRDNGPGISRENQRKIFKPFFQVMDSGNPSEGTGLGLSIALSMVEAHSGSLRVDSAPGCGAAFIATLPIRQSAAVVAEVASGNEDATDNDAADTGRQTPAGPHDGGKPTLLVVDDNEEMLAFLSGNFSADYEVATARDGEEAMEILRSRTVSMIISDWMMPRMNGLELCKAVRSDANFSHIPFVLLTARTDNYSKIEGMNCSADAYVEKPFSVNYLEARIRNLLELRAMLLRKFSQQPLEPITTIAQTPVDDVFLTRLTAIIEENFTNPDLSVDFLATAMNISRSSLYAKIKTLADVTPNELIQLTRLKRAAKLLTENKYRISEISYMVGFNSSSYFAKCFQKQFGKRPGEFIG